MLGQRGSLLNTIIASIITAAIIVGGYKYLKLGGEGEATFSPEQKKQIKESVVELIEEKPEIFLGAINNAAQKQQEKIRQDLEATAAKSKADLLSAAIALGSTQNNDVKFIAFLDPMCPHCNEFQKIAYHVLKKQQEKHQDVSFYFIPVAVLGPNSEAMAKIMIGAAEQGIDKMRKFQEKFIDNIEGMNRKKLLSIAKEVGLNIDKLEKAELSEVIKKTVERNNLLGEKIKLQGIPTVFVTVKDDGLRLVPPTSLEGFIKIIDEVKKTGTFEINMKEIAKNDNDNDNDKSTDDAPKEKKSSGKSKKNHPAE